jgi:hypothetical protein
VPNRNIPRRTERLIVAEAFRDMMAISGGFFGGKCSFAQHAEEYVVLLAVWIEHLHGRPATAYKLATLTGMPRTTMVRKLELLIAMGLVVREGQRYRCSDRVANEVPPSTSPVVNVILRAAEQLTKLGTSLRSSTTRFPTVLAL